MNNRIVIVGADDWEGLFVNGELVDEGHTLNDGMSRKKYLSNLCKKYNVDLDAIIEGYVTCDYDDYLYDSGGFHKNISNVAFDVIE